MKSAEVPACPERNHSSSQMFRKYRQSWKRSDGRDLEPRIRGFLWSQDSFHHSQQTSPQVCTLLQTSEPQNKHDKHMGKIVKGPGILNNKDCQLHFDGYVSFYCLRTVVPNLWVMTPLAVEPTLLQGLPKTICISDVYITIWSSNKIIVMK